MRKVRAMRGQVVADIGRGRFGSVEEIGTAALVVMPFTITLMVFVSQVARWLPSVWLIGLFAVVQVAATFWNAGWRARTSAEHD
jgi:hypothetical protein